MKNTTNMKPVSDRVMLEPFLGAYADMVGGIHIPDSAKQSLQTAKPQYRWLPIIGVGKGCLEVNVGDEALVHEAQVEQVVIKGEESICYIREAQIIMTRDAQPTASSSSVD